MGDIPAQLGAAFGTCTAQERAVLIPLHLCAADGAGLRQKIGFGPGGTLFLHHIQNFRDDLAGLADVDGIADPDVPLGNEVLIVQCGIGHRSACQPHGPYHRLGGQHTGTAYLDHDILHHGLLDLRRILVSDRPLGKLGSRAHPLPLGQVVDLDHRAVDVTGQFRPIFVDGEHIIVDLLHPAQLLIGNDLKTQIFQIIQRLGMGGKRHAFRQLDIENENVQSPFRGDLGIQLPQGTRRGISGVCKEGLALLFLPGIELFEALFGHIHLTADNEPRRRIVNGHGNGADGL